MLLNSFKDALLQVMERKSHWAWPLFTSGQVSKELLHHHLEQEYGVYVHDFAWMLGRAYAQCSVPEARVQLAEKLFEEETGGLSMGIPHAQLFLRFPAGLGMDLDRFEGVRLLPQAQSLRDLLDDCTSERGWEVATAVTTLFLEGTSHERGELDSAHPKRPEPALVDHPLHRHYGLPLDCLALTRVHRQVEDDHRVSAWRIILDHVGPLKRRAVLAAMEETLEAWLLYRDEAAEACGLIGPSIGLRSVSA
jgi:pyrroloquinoline quinone (PQQ) biosynthesis protein C